MGTARDLWSHHAFVDVETTGLDPGGDEVIELGALFLDRGHPVRRISLLFAPKRPLSPTIVRLTGLTDELLRGRPPFERYEPELKEALAGWTVVAHNAIFERSFLDRVLGPPSTRILDSCELLHYLYPELESHSLDAMLRAFGLGNGAKHRALSDCEDTHRVLCHALDLCLTQNRADDVGDLVACLGQVADERILPQVEILKGLHELFVENPIPVAAQTKVPELPMTYDEGAPRAYLRALSRRAGPGKGTPSAWFKERFPKIAYMF